MGVEFIRIPGAILHLKGLSLRQKCILSLVVGFNHHGLRMTNSQLAELFGCSPDAIRHDLHGVVRRKGRGNDKSGLVSRGLVRVEGSTSKRVLKAGENMPQLPAKLPQGEESTTGTDAARGDQLPARVPPTTGTGAHQNMKGRENRKERKTPPTPRERGADGVRASFELFWAVYPKKESPEKARKVWKKLRPSPDLVEQILASVEEHKRCDQWKREKGRFIPEACNWLDGRRWESDLGSAAEAAKEAEEREKAEWRRQLLEARA